jgi:hypothetical protein
MSIVKLSDIATAGIVEGYENFAGSQKVSTKRVIESGLYNIAGRMVESTIAAVLPPMIIISTANISSGIVAVVDSLVRQGQGWKSAGVDGLKVAVASYLADQGMKSAGVVDKVLL